MVAEVLGAVAAALVLIAIGTGLYVQRLMLASMRSLLEDRERDRQVINNALHAFAEAMCNTALPDGTTKKPPTQRELQRAAAAAYIDRVNRHEPRVQLRLPKED